jgi:ABC-type antimicrobial peptide transport system permease subunit
VQQRTHEIGIRTALGASPSRPQAHIMFQTLRLAALGLIIGICGSLIMTRSLASLLFGVNAHDPWPRYLFIDRLIATKYTTRAFTKGS